MAPIEQCIFSLRRVKVLSNESLQVLRGRGDKAEKIGGWRLVRNTSYIIQGSVDHAATVCIPDALNSIETLEFLDFSGATAVDLWNRFCSMNRPGGSKPDLLKVIKDHIRSFEASEIENAGRGSDLTSRLGMTMEFDGRLRCPRWKNTRFEGGLKEWILLLIEMRYDLLLSLDEVIRFGNRQPMAKLHPSVFMVNIR